MKRFLQRFGAFVLGVLCGFDRIRFRGNKRQLCYPNGILGHLCHRRLRLKDFKAYALDTTASLCQVIETPAKQAGILRYLNSSQASTEATALQIAAEHQLSSGLIAVLARVEPALIVQVRGRRTGTLAPRLESGKCLHYYHYYLDRAVGLRYTRLQTWFPFTMHIGLNGRDWLAGQMKQAGIDFVQKDNCFTWIKDLDAAQRLMDRQLQTAWPELLSAWAEHSNPLEKTWLGGEMPYYWTAQEAEYATDLLFRTPEHLQRFYPWWVHYAYRSLKATSLLQYMNYRLRRDGQPYQRLVGEVQTTIKEALGGTCVRHRILGNLLKMYDKQGSVLRIENLLTNLKPFKVFRTVEGQEQAKQYLPLRKGVADLHRRAELSQKINERYLEGLATVEEKTSLAEVTKDLGQRTTWKGRSVRALNPLAPADVALLEAVHRGEFMIQGFRNRDLRGLLFAHQPAADALESKRQSAKITRLLGLLRGHSLIAKIPKTHRYQVTNKGRASIGVLLAARAADAKLLFQAA
jgi:hypothetical protein